MCMETYELLSILELETMLFYTDEPASMQEDHKKPQNVHSFSLKPSGVLAFPISARTPI